MKVKSLVIAALLALAFVAPPAAADNPRISAQIFRPGTHPGDFVNVQGARVDGHLRWSARAMLSFGKNPFVYLDKTSGTPR